MTLRERILGDETQQVVKLLWVIRKAVDAALMALGESPIKDDPPPHPVTGCRHPNMVNITTMGDETERHLCPDCDVVIERRLGGV